MIEIHSRDGTVVYRSDPATSVKHALEIAAINADEITHAYFHNEDLSSGQLANLQLKSCQFENCNFEETDFDSARIKSSEFRHCIFQSTNFEQAELKRVRLCGDHNTQEITSTALAAVEPTLSQDIASVIAAHATPNKLRSVNFLYTQLLDCTFENLTFKACDFANTTITGSRFLACNLRRADLSSTLFQRNRLEHTNLQKIQLLNRSITTSHFINCDLSGAQINGADFQHCYFLQTICHRLQASRSDIGPAHLIKCSLIHCDFTAADLSDCTFKRSTFDHAIFNNTNLARTKFDFSNLRGCEFQNGSRFTDTQIKGGEWLRCSLTDAAYQNASFVNVEMKDVTLTQTPAVAAPAP